MDRTTRERVRARAAGRCEYCGLLQLQSASVRFHVEHIRAIQHGGDNSLDNLCLACPFCNSSKGTNQSAFDPLTGELVRLFHPRLNNWQHHFREESGWIIGLTAEGRATVALLQMNRDYLVRLRQFPIEKSD